MSEYGNIDLAFLTWRIRDDSLPWQYRELTWKILKEKCPICCHWTPRTLMTNRRWRHMQTVTHIAAQFKVDERELLAMIISWLVLNTDRKTVGKVKRQNGVKK